MTEEEHEYKSKVVFARKSKAGNHIYAFNKDGVLGGEVGSLIFNVADIEKLLGGEVDWIKISITSAEEEGE
jgi:hypothetical protein